MSRERRHMLAALRPSDSAAISRIRSPSFADAPALAALMMDAYAGTVDHDEGETEEDALAEVESTLSGHRGPYLEHASRVIEIDGKIVSAVLVIRWEKLPFVAFTMTSSKHKRQGLARACMVSAMNALHGAGETRVRLLVTLANGEAVALYRSLGFSFEE